MNKKIYLPKYDESRAIIIGIDKYQHVSPLLQACSDAKAIAQTLIDTFDFKSPNVTLLLNEHATRENIRREYFRYVDQSLVGEDDRILIFFAGHGHTVTGRRGETGFLVPVDGNPDDLSTLIRWDDLTQNAELIPAKHMLFLMDACYGGLAITRALPSGSSRFLKDMLQRYARQVLTAGKADEEVSDGGGSRPGHSIFTSYVLDGMEGSAASDSGIITGQGLMAYVYKNVGTDPHSHQTPHFGFFDGDGDFIFNTEVLEKLKSSGNEQPDLDVLIKNPTFQQTQRNEETTASILKRLISTPGDRILLDDFLSELLRQAINELGQSKFPSNTQLTDENFSERIQSYENVIADVQVAAILLAKWANGEQIELLKKIFQRIADADVPTSGTMVWLRLASYPILFLMYSAGISALAAERYDSLGISLLTQISPPLMLSHRGLRPVVEPTITELTEIHDQFKRLPDMQRKYVPRSEHLYKKLQPMLEDQLFLGKSYDSLFDRFEIFLALTYADLRDDKIVHDVWGPPGRFGWKERGRGGSEHVFTKFVEDAESQGQNWPPLRYGFFGGSAQRFKNVADAYARFLSQINFW